MVALASTFTGLRFENPFLLASAPPTESDSNIMRAFDAGWGGVVTKTIGLHPVVNVDGPKTKFLRADPDSPRLSMQKRPGTALHSSWNWELISDKPLDWWVPRISRIKRAYPNRVLVASIMAGSGSDEELKNWQALATACQDEGADALELNLSCPHMDRQDMGSNIGKDTVLISTVTQAVKEVARVPIWAKLTPSTTDIVVEARGAFLGGADAITSSNTFPSLPLIDPETLDFEMNVDGFVSSGGLGGPGDPAVVDGEDGAAHAGVSRQVVLGDRRRGGVRARAQLLPARVRDGAGLHGCDARSRDRPERPQAAARGDDGHDGASRLEDARRLPRHEAEPGRRALEDPAPRRQGVSRWIRGGGLRRRGTVASPMSTSHGAGGTEESVNGSSVPQCLGAS